MGQPQASFGSGLAPQLNAALAERALQYATPQQIPRIQHSAYLADALQNIAKSGSQNLRTPTALGSNLLAEALLGFASNRANKQLAASDASNWANVSGAQAGMLDQANSALGGAAPSQAPPGPSAPPPAAPTPAAGAPAPTPPQAGAGAAPGPPASPQLSDADRAAMANTMWGEARGEPMQGQEAVADAILNRARETGLPVSAVVAQPHQFAGYDPGRQLTPQQQAQMLAAAGPALNGHDITGGADHFFNPALANPSWGQGPGQMFGHQKFMALNDQGARPAAAMAQPSAFAQSMPPQQASTATAAQAPPAPRPLQVSTGPDPSVPAPNVQGPSGASPNPVPNPGAPPSPANSAPQGQPGAAPSSPGFALGPVPIQPQQRARLQQLQQLASQHPQFRQPYMEMVQQLQQQVTTGEPYDISRPNDAGQVILTGKVTGRQVIRQPNGVIVAAGPKMASDGQGGFSQVPGTGFQQLQGAPPGSMLQQNQATGEVKADAIPGGQQNGMAWNAQQGRYVPVPGLQYQDVPGPPNAITQRGPNGELHVQANPAFGAVPAGMSYQPGGAGGAGVQAQPVGNALPLDQKLELTKGFVGSKEYQDYQESSVALNSLKALATQKTGPATFAAFDQYLRASNPGVSARPSALELAEQMFGKQSAAYAEVNSWVNRNGAVLPPQILQGMITGAQSMTAARYQALKPQIDAYTYTAKRNGIDPSEIMPPVTPPDGYGAAPGAALGGAPAPQASVQQPPMAGARRAPDGNWYVQKGNQFYLVRP